MAGQEWEKTKPDDVLKLKAPTPGFLCPLSANIYGIDFLSFAIRDMDTKRVVFEVAKDPSARPEFPEDFDYDQLRTIKYKFPAAFLRLRTVGTKLKFSNGPKPAKNFRMIERHYARGKLVKSYDFNFVFCMPDSVNEWEAIYDMPQLTDAEMAEMIAHPETNASDSFYFVNDQLIMHNKAFYEYETEQAAAAATAARVDQKTQAPAQQGAQAAPQQQPQTQQPAAARPAAAPSGQSQPATQPAAQQQQQPAAKPAGKPGDAYAAKGKQ